jgi:hypothetical protein
MSRSAFAAHVRALQGALLAVLLALGGCIGAGQQSTPSTSGTPSASPPPATSSATAGEGGDLFAPLGYDGPGTIGFTRYDPSIRDSGAYVIRPDGSGELRLLVTTNWAGEPAQFNGMGCCGVLSPDGNDVAVGYQDNSGLFGDSNWFKVQILGLDGSRVASVPMACGSCASVGSVDIFPRAWSPDGALLALSVFSDDDPSRGGMNIASVDGSPGWWIQVTGNHDEFPITFSPDSRRILFLRASREGRGALMEATLPDDLADMVNGQEIAVRPVSPDGWTVAQDDYLGPAASYSPDGSQIAFVADDGSGNGSRVYVVAAAGGEPVAIAGPAAILVTAAWSPDGAWIAFDGALGGGRPAAHVVHPDGSGLVDLTSASGLGACCLHWSPDSRALLIQATATDNDHAELFVVPVDGSPIFQVTQSPALYENVSWGPASP